MLGKGIGEDEGIGDIRTHNTHLIDKDDAIVKLVAQLQNVVQPPLALSVVLVHDALQRNVAMPDSLAQHPHQNHITLLCDDAGDGRLSGTWRTLKQQRTRQRTRITEREAHSGIALLSRLSSNFTILLRILDGENDRVLDVLAMIPTNNTHLLNLVVSGNLVPNVLILVHLRRRDLLRRVHGNAHALQSRNDVLRMKREML